MTHSKYSEDVANWKLRQTDTEKGIQRNIKILIAQGLKMEVAKRTAYRIARGEIDNIEMYVHSLFMGDESNFAEDWLRWQWGVYDEENIDPSLWADIKDEEKPQYTSKLKQRLQKRADEKRDQLLIERAMENEVTSFWRESPRKFSTSNLG